MINVYDAYVYVAGIKMLDDTTNKFKGKYSFSFKIVAI